MSELENVPAEESPAPEKKRPIGRIIVVAIVLIAAFFGVKNWLYNRNHESTDNAQVAGDVVLVAPLVQGTVSEILVSDNEVVKKGQPIVRLDPSKLTAVFNQARANLTAALADAKSAGMSVTFAEATARASQASAAGAAGEAGADVGAARAAANAAQASIRGSQAEARAASADVETARVEAQVARESLARINASIEAAQAEYEWSKSGVGQANAAFASATAEHDQAVRNLNRVKSLFEQGAESRQALEVAQAGETTTAQAMEAARNSVSMAQSTSKVKEAAVRSANSLLKESRALVTQAETRVKTAAQRASSAQAGVDVARMQASANLAKVNAAAAHQTTAQGQAETAHAAQINVEKLRADQKQALAKVDQASAALKAAQIDLDHAVIIAPCDGRVSKRAVEVGSFVQVGTAMMYVVPDQSIYVLANFKETQVAKMKPGEKVEIEVDSLPGQKFEGQIDSISAATGSTFALLPPDNATGNFVKVVQRVPVKIRFDEDAMADQRLRVGMSAVVAVEVP